MKVSGRKKIANPRVVKVSFWFFFIFFMKEKKCVHFFWSCLDEALLKPFWKAVTMSIIHLNLFKYSENTDIAHEGVTKIFLIVSELLKSTWNKIELHCLSLGSLGEQSSFQKAPKLKVTHNHVIYQT